LDEWYFTVGQNAPSALPSFIDCFISAYIRFENLPINKDDNGYIRSKYPLLDFRFETMLKQLASKLELQNALMGSLRAVLDQVDPLDPSANLSQIIKRYFLNILNYLSFLSFFFFFTFVLSLDLKKRNLLSYFIFCF